VQQAAIGVLGAERCRHDYNHDAANKMAPSRQKDPCLRTNSLRKDSLRLAEGLLTARMQAIAE
jgi:hypothetical protein